RRPELRERALLRVLPQLAGDRQLPQRTVTALAAAYRYLRTLENRIQAQNDEQTHDLPADAEPRERLAYALHCRGWPELAASLAAQRAVVEVEFERVAWEAEGATSSAPDLQASAWAGGDVAALVAGTALAGDARAAELLTDLRHGPLYQRMDEVGRQRLSAVIVRTIDTLADHAVAARCLERVLPIYRAVARRSAYLALLNENPAALERLLKLVLDSSWLARRMAEQPLLLDELLDNRLFEAPPSR